MRSVLPLAVVQTLPPGEGWFRSATEPAFLAHRLPAVAAAGHGLPVGPAPEQALITTVRLAVVNHVGLATAAAGAALVAGQCEERLALALPLRAVAALASGRPPRISSSGAPALARAQRTGIDAVAAGTTARRALHGQAIGAWREDASRATTEIGVPLLCEPPKTARTRT